MTVPACLLLWIAAAGTLPRDAAAPQARAPSPVDVSSAAHHVVTALDAIDVSSSTALYEAQQEHMTLVEAVFRFGTPAERTAVLRSAAGLIADLPKVADLLTRSVVSRELGRLELRAPILTRLRQRLGSLEVSVDGLPFPTGPVRNRRVLPIVIDGRVTVQSEVVLQFGYLLSTMVRLAAIRPLATEEPLRAVHDSSVAALFDFLVEDNVVPFWRDLPAWHWTGPFRNMEARVGIKLAAKDRRVLEPPWFGAMVDHELHLFAVGADLLAAGRIAPVLRRRLSPEQWSILVAVRGATLRMLRQRITTGSSGEGFLVDYGLWTSNPSYAYAGCTAVSPLPEEPCPVAAVATDASHARRWPWWLRTFAASWEPDTRERREVEALFVGLAGQFGSRVLASGPGGRPLTRNYMDGRDGWYHFRDEPGREWGHGPGSLTGAMRYGSWALLAPLDERIATAQRRFCEVVSSEAADDIIFRTKYYGSASDRPELAGLGETDLYGATSVYALICRLNAGMGRD